MENESATNTPGGIAYFKTMYALSKQLDPNRYVSFADDLIAFVDPATNASRFADFIMWNQYFGSWDGPENLLLPAIEKISKGYPDKMVLVSEFGYPGCLRSMPVLPTGKGANHTRTVSIARQTGLDCRSSSVVLPGLPVVS